MGVPPVICKPTLLPVSAVVGLRSTACFHILQEINFPNLKSFPKNETKGIRSPLAGDQAGTFVVTGNCLCSVSLHTNVFHSLYRQHLTGKIFFNFYRYFKISTTGNTTADRI